MLASLNSAPKDVVGFFFKFPSIVPYEYHLHTRGKKMTQWSAVVNKYFKRLKYVIPGRERQHKMIKVAWVTS